MIYPNTALKQKNIRTRSSDLLLTNADPKKAQELLKTVLNSKTLFVDDKASLLVMRDTPERCAWRKNSSRRWIWSMPRS